MRRFVMLLGVLALGAAGCGGRSTTIGGDGAVTPPADGPVVLPDAPASCTSLVQLGQVSLEYADTNKFAPAIAYDGDGFAVVWHTQSIMVSSLTGELRFARVDRSGKTGTPSGVRVSDDNGVTHPSLLAQGTAAKEYVVVHQPATSSTCALKRLDASGQVKSTVAFSSSFRRSALAPHPSGLALLIATVPMFHVMDSAGTLSHGSPLTSAQVMASLWLAQRPGGYAAALHSTNNNASLWMLDGSGGAQVTSGVGHGAQIYSPSFAVLGTGYASVYGLNVRDIEIELYDAAGKRTGHRTLSSSSPTSTSQRQTAAAWTGRHLLVGYPGAVSGQFMLQPLSAGGVATGSAVRLKSCVATDSTIGMAWGGDRLAVASVSHASGLSNTAICVTIMGCQ